ncbi:Dyp-type peroxidase [Corynebacterium doosanense]|uniref:Dyp-type peroxidase n=1 Tax=Corynebacterium doosanense TaxID=1121358 RepID=UPI00037051B5|nr:Dyp-type peroxidase [Corynebacterium doosanense]
MGIMRQDIVEKPSRSGVFLVVEIDHTREAEEAARDTLSRFDAFTRSVGFRHPEDGLTAVVGIGARAWDRLFSLPRPVDLTEFEEIRGAKHVAPATGGDLLIHLRAEHEDMCFELARIPLDNLGEGARVTDEVRGFKYFNQRDLLGFVDGTANPRTERSLEAVYIPKGEPWEGSTYVTVQRYSHDLSSWNAETVEEQERVIGRTKLSDVAFPAHERPSNSHVALNTVTDESGEELKIYRLNMPFGSMAERTFGTFSIGYTHQPEIIRMMLRNMFIGRPEGNYDRILDYSTAHTGATFFVPTYDFLATANNDGVARR